MEKFLSGNNTSSIAGIEDNVYINFTLITTNELPIDSEIIIDWEGYPQFDVRTLALECPGWFCGFETSGIDATTSGSFNQLTLTNGIYEPYYPLIQADT